MKQVTKHATNSNQNIRFVGFVLLTSLLYKLVIASLIRIGIANNIVTDLISNLAMIANKNVNTNESKVTMILSIEDFILPPN